MNRYRVTLPMPLEPEIIEADWYTVGQSVSGTAFGILSFKRIGRDGEDDVADFAAGHWCSVKLIEGETGDAQANAQG